MVRIAILVFGALAVIVLLGLARSSYDAAYCTEAMAERGAIGSTSDAGSCLLAFADGTTESFAPSGWARHSRDLAVVIGLALGIYGVVSRPSRRSRTAKNGPAQ